MDYVCFYKPLFDSLFKKSIVAFAICLFSLAGFSQKFNAVNWNRYFSNDSVKFDILFVSPDRTLKGGPDIAQYVVSIRMPKKDREQLSKMDTIFWYSYLNNTNTDFATSLMLYHLCNGDGVFLSHVKHGSNGYLSKTWIYKSGQIFSEQIRIGCIGNSFVSIGIRAIAYNWVLALFYQWTDCGAYVLVFI